MLVWCFWGLTGKWPKPWPNFFLPSWEKIKNVCSDISSIVFCNILQSWCGFLFCWSIICFLLWLSHFLSLSFFSEHPEFHLFMSQMCLFVHSSWVPLLVLRCTWQSHILIYFKFGNLEENSALDWSPAVQVGSGSVASQLASQTRHFSLLPTSEWWVCELSSSDSLPVILVISRLTFATQMYRVDLHCFD